MDARDGNEMGSPQIVVVFYKDGLSWLAGLVDAVRKMSSVSRAYQAMHLTPDCATR